MKNLFIPYDLALAMKELGFDESCFTLFDQNKDLCMHLIKGKGIKNSQKRIGDSNWIAAPLYQQAFKWFREKYNFEGIPQRADDYYWYKFDIYRYEDNCKKYVMDYQQYSTYEEAELECMKKLIEIINEMETMINFKDITVPLKKRQMAFVEDMFNYYSVDPGKRRSYDTITGCCKYAPMGDNTEGCAIGRFLNSELQKELDKTNYTVLQDACYSKLPDWMKSLGQDFLQKCQVAHDGEPVWESQESIDVAKQHIIKWINE